jgi:glycosyltransferase involved in cell wall biosynthesis
MEPTNSSTENSLPLVSIISICYNHERFVKDCLESIRRQAYPNLQIIITDDCSKDSSVALIREWMVQNPALPTTFISNDQNRGLCKSLNQAIALARGKYISMIATDDIWKPGKISRQVSVMESLPETVGVLYSDAERMDETGAPLPGRFIESYRQFDRMPEGNIQEQLWDGNFIPAMTTLIRRSVFDKVGLYDEGLFYEDWDMWLRVSEHYHFAYDDRPSAIYRVVQTSMSKSSVDRMTVANELIFTKNLLSQQVPQRMLSQAFNFAVRRAYRQKAVNRTESRELLKKLALRYRSPRLFIGWVFFTWGLDIKWFESAVAIGKKLAHPLK